MSVSGKSSTTDCTHSSVLVIQAGIDGDRGAPPDPARNVATTAEWSLRRDVAKMLCCKPTSGW